MITIATSQMRTPGRREVERLVHRSHSRWVGSGSPEPRCLDDQIRLTDPETEGMFRFTFGLFSCCLGTEHLHVSQTRSVAPFKCKCK